ncbi:hypothetical protein G6O69_34990 [Pseudenhygromyxa sp. WMMC2535]|uniref:hypothetical protein n=1 Tax=Pseudenhygromyxa sp. WMMC2535 TaxID=2712867 RepID=UPI001552259D|nr:hypothetical protein [Pseudenhygromyxa sp. WMMC2535]NVB43082.1 hypothetical protein [Pseudenhygromyxa sp. WMMC2535]
MDELPRSSSARWLSSNPQKAAAERFYLFYTPVWITFMAVVMLSGIYRRWGDPGFMLFGTAVAAPMILVPMLGARKPGPDQPAQPAQPFWRSVWLRLNLWNAIFVFIGSYFFTHYFFDVLGMRYRFPTQWNLQAALVGTGDPLDPGLLGGGREVPLFLYPLTLAYFMTYHVAMTVTLRWLRTRFELGTLGRVVALVVLAYATAFAETFFMAIPALEDVFEYLDRGRMLAWGSVFYACFFVVSVPMFARIDEDEPWTAGRTAISALATGMAVFIILDLWALVLGPL